MDFDFRASAIYAAQHLSAVQAACLHSDNYMAFYDSDGEDDARSYFPCPFCCLEIEVPVLCSHLQEEHCFDLKSAVCPLCAANLGKDAIRHFMVEHSSSLKRRWKSEKSSIWSGNSSMLQKKLAANTRGNKHESTPDPLLSPFICNVAVPIPNSIHQDKCSNNSALVISAVKSNLAYDGGVLGERVNCRSNVYVVNPGFELENSDNSYGKPHFPGLSNDQHVTGLTNCDPVQPAEDDGREAGGVGDGGDHEERRQRAAFVQELVASTIF